jgi:starch synthase
VRILHVASEMQPLVKTGGLGDVVSALPAAQAALGHDVRILIPAYREALARAGDPSAVASLRLPGLPGTATLLEASAAPPGTVAWLLDYGPAFDRPGNPYVDAGGLPWEDNAERFALLSRAAVVVACGDQSLDWQPDVVHCHDWQTGLVAPLLDESTRLVLPPVTVFTIHNLSYQGLFPEQTFRDLGLSAPLWSMHGLEFNGRLSFIKGGIAFSDWVTTVSPTYAAEIRTAPLGAGLEGLLDARGDRLVGILNGIDSDGWNPATDPFIDSHYDAGSLDRKAANGTALAARLGLEGKGPVLGFIGRLVEQKGVDLIVDAMPGLLDAGVRFACLGTGERLLEQRLGQLARSHRGRVGVEIGYDEGLAHLIEAGADLFLMPSRFEPCGLNQMYSLRYGTPPVVRRTGGLADTVVDATPATLADGTATGFVFDAPSASDLSAAVRRALDLHSDRDAWRRLMSNGMKRDFSWRASAMRYLELYRT